MKIIATTNLQTTNILHDYWSLCKPKVVLLMLITAWAGMFLALYSIVHPLHHNFSTNYILQTTLFSSIGIFCAGSAAAVVNQLLDRHIDRKMLRTQWRPLAQGRISITNAIFFAVMLTVLAIFVLGYYVNILTMWLTLLTSIGYAYVYTVWLKRATPQNIVIGGIAGATPPLLGWASFSNSITPEALLLVLIIFTWTPPHFWSLAIYRNSDYSDANIPMLPVTHGIRFTQTFIFLYAILLGLVCMLPYLTGMAGTIYLLSALWLNINFIYQTYKLLILTDDAKMAQAQQAAIVFYSSIKFLTILFSVLILDALVFNLFLSGR